jgi:hypothetical protein
MGGAREPRPWPIVCQLCQRTSSRVSRPTAGRLLRAKLTIHVDSPMQRPAPPHSQRFCEFREHCLAHAGPLRGGARSFARRASCDAEC